MAYHRLDETLFPRQEFGGLPNLRQRARSFYLQTVSESSTALGITSGQISQEFYDPLRDQLEAHHRPEQENVEIAEDVYEIEMGRRPDRTRR